jgi:hypothetical protein
MVFADEITLPQLMQRRRLHLWLKRQMAFWSFATKNATWFDACSGLATRPGRPSRHLYLHSTTRRCRWKATKTQIITDTRCISWQEPPDD